jgi:ribosomal protein L11 methyltransferase
MFTEAALEVDRAQADALSDALIEAGALSASIEDADAGSERESPIFGEPGIIAESAWQRSRILALFDAAQDIDAAVRRALDAAGLSRQTSFSRRAVEDADWVRLTQSQFELLQVGPRLAIVPSWRERDAALPGSVIVELDPGLAFGTGSHPTTGLCLQWLEAHVRPGMSVIDYGCGSGILAIAAEKLGATDVLGTDIDTQALSASRSNALANACKARFVSAQDLPEQSADVVIANILANPLCLLAPVLCSLVKQGGTLVLSGILERQYQHVAAAYLPFMALTVWAVQDGWVCLVGCGKSPKQS